MTHGKQKILLFSWIIWGTKIQISLYEHEEISYHKSPYTNMEDSYDSKMNPMWHTFTHCFFVIIFFHFPITSTLFLDTGQTSLFLVSVSNVILFFSHFSFKLFFLSWVNLYCFKIFLTGHPGTCVVEKFICDLWWIDVKIPVNYLTKLTTLLLTLACRVLYPNEMAGWVDCWMDGWLDGWMIIFQFITLPNLSLLLSLVLLVKVHTNRQLLKWINTTFFSNFFPQTNYKGTTLQPLRKLFISDQTNFRMGPARFRLLRMRSGKYRH